MQFNNRVENDSAYDALLNASKFNWRRTPLHILDVKVRQRMVGWGVHNRWAAKWPSLELLNVGGGWGSGGGGVLHREPVGGVRSCLSSLSCLWNAL